MSKNCLNPECKKEFEPKSDKGVYCSPKCKSRHQYLSNKKSAQAPPIEPTRPFRDPTRPWIEEIELYCLRTGLYPNDLIDFHKQVQKTLKARQ